MSVGALQHEWADLGDPFRQCLDQAAAALWAGGLAVGAVITDADGTVVAHGRNHAYDPATGDDPLERTPIAHAEMNALAGLDTDADLASHTIWSTHQPCPMCSAAIDFVGVGTTRALAPDPSDEVATSSEGSNLWIVVANVLFLSSVLQWRGTAAPTIVRSRHVEPELTELAIDLRSAGRLAPGPLSLVDGLDPIWADVASAAEQRGRRVAR